MRPTCKQKNSGTIYLEVLLLAPALITLQFFLFWELHAIAAIHWTNYQLAQHGLAKLAQKPTRTRLDFKESSSHETIRVEAHKTNRSITLKK